MWFLFNSNFNKIDGTLPDVNVTVGERMYAELSRVTILFNGYLLMATKSQKMTK